MRTQGATPYSLRPQQVTPQGLAISFQCSLVGRAGFEPA